MYKKIITKLVSNGWLIRIKRGLYAISDFSNRGFLSLSPYTVANLLVNDSYVSFETALAYHGMFDQLTEKVISISQVRFKTAKLNTTEYSFINTKDKFFFGWQEVKIDNRTARIATIEKALIDTVHFHKNIYSIDLVIEKMSKYQTSLNIARLSKYVSKMSSTTIKIFGYIFDLLNIDSSSLHKLVKNNKGTHWMLVGDKKFNAKWRMYYNEYFDKYRLEK